MQTPAKSKRLRWQSRERASFCRDLREPEKARRLPISSQNALAMAKKCCSFLKSWQPWMWFTTSWSKRDSPSFAYSSTAIKQIKRMSLRIFATPCVQGKVRFPRKRTLKLLSRKRHSISWMPMRLNFTRCARSLKKACISCMNLTPHFGPRQMLSFLSLSLLPKAKRTWQKQLLFWSSIQTISPPSDMIIERIRGTAISIRTHLISQKKRWKVIFLPFHNSCRYWFLYSRKFLSNMGYSVPA